MITQMTMKTLTGLALLLALMPGGRAQPCPDAPSCRCLAIFNRNTLSFESLANCTGAGLTTIPAQLPPKLVYMDFTGNTLLAENVHSVCGFKFLRSVSLTDNHLNNIASGQLNNCSSLRSLTLTGNVIDFLSDDAFKGVENLVSIHGLEVRKIAASVFSKLSKLNHLTLTLHQSHIPAQLLDGLKLVSLKINIENSLTLPATFLAPVVETLNALHVRSPSLQTLAADFLYGDGYLDILELEMNDIHTLPALLFQQMTAPFHLTHVHIAGVRSLPRAIFNPLSGLLYLDIHEAEDMPADLFEGLLALQHLNLSNCYIGYGQIPPGWFSDLWSLTTLGLQNTNIEVVYQVDFGGLDSIEVLDLSHNNIRMIKAGIFDHVSDTLQELRLNNNMIGVINSNAFKGIRGLRILDLSYNKIFELPYALLFNLDKLEYLNLHENKLFDMDGSSFKYLSNLQDLDLGYNIIHIIPTKLFTKMTSLKHLSLTGNRILTLSYAIFASLHSLKTLDVDHNPIICSCNLVEINDKLVITSVSGTCELNAIIYDISELQYPGGCEVSSSTSQSNVLIPPTTTVQASKEATPTVTTNTPYTPPTRSVTISKTTIMGSGSITSTVVYGEHSLSKISDEPMSKIAIMGEIAATPKVNTTVDHAVNKLEGNMNTPEYPMSNNNSGTQDVTAVEKDMGVNDDNGINLHEHTHEHFENEQNISVFNETAIGSPEFSFKGGDNVTQGEFYMAVGFMCVVSAGCVGILALLVYKKRRSGTYELTDSAFDPDTLIQGESKQSGSNGATGGVLKEVPSLQIESMDDDGTVHVTEYSVEDIPIFFDNNANDEKENCSSSV